MINLIFLKQSLRAIVKRPLTSLMFIFTVLVVGVSFLILLSSNNIIQQSFSYRNTEKFGTSDILIELGNNYEQRFFSIRPLDEISDEIEYTVSIFVLPVRTSENSTALIYFVDYQNFLNLFSDTNRTNLNLNGFNALVSSTDFDTSTLDINIRNQEYNISIIGTFEKNGIINDVDMPIIIMDRSVLNQVIGIPYFDKMYNQVYLKVKDNQIKESVLNQVTSLFSKQSVRLVNNTQDFENDSKMYTNTINLISIVTFFPLGFILFLLFKLNFQAKEKEMLTLRSIGITKRKAFHFFGIEYLIFSFFGFIFSILIWYFISIQMAKFLTGEDLFLVSNPFLLCVATFLFILIFIFFFFSISFKKLFNVTYLKVHSNVNLKYYRPKGNSNIKKLGITLLILCLIFFVFSLIAPHFPITSINHLIKGIVSVFLEISIIVITLLFILTLLGYLFKKDTRFNKVEIPFLARHKLQYWFMLTIIFSGVAITFAFYSLNNILPTIQSSRDDLNYNLLVTNITTRHSEYEGLLSNQQEIEWYNEGFCYQNIVLENYNITIPLTISIQGDSLKTFTNFSFDEKTIEMMNNHEELAIVLAEKYHKVYGLNIGDLVDLKINNNQQIQSYRIAGFIDEKIETYAFINTYGNDNSLSTHPFNAVYIRTNDIDLVQNELEKDLISDSVQFIQLDNYYHNLIEDNLNRIDFIQLFVSLITVSLLLTISFLFTFIYFDNLKIYDILIRMGGSNNLPVFLLKATIMALITGILTIFSSIILARGYNYLLFYIKSQFTLINIEKTSLIVALSIVVLCYILYGLEWFFIQKRKFIRKQQNL